VFEKYEAWPFSSPSSSTLFAQAMSFWQQSGYLVTPTSPQSFQGRSFQPRLGIHRLVDVTVFPSGSGATVQVRFRASVTDEGLVVGAVIGILALPVAAIGGAVSWHEYEQDWSAVRWGFWNFLIQTVRAVPLTPVSVIPPSPPPPSSTSEPLR
jgi:hypothetical protein